MENFGNNCFRKAPNGGGSGNNPNLNNTRAIPSIGRFNGCQNSVDDIYAHIINLDASSPEENAPQPNYVSERVNNEEVGGPSDVKAQTSSPNLSDIGSNVDIVSSEFIANDKNYQWQTNNLNNELGKGVQTKSSGVDYTNSIISLVPNFNQNTSSDITPQVENEPQQYFIDSSSGNLAIVSHYFLPTDTAVTKKFGEVIDLTKESIGSVQRVLAHEGIIKAEEPSIVASSKCSPENDSIADSELLVVDPLRLKTHRSFERPIENQTEICDIEKIYFEFPNNVVSKKPEDYGKQNRRKQVLNTMPGSDNLTFEIQKIGFGKEEKSPCGENNALMDEINEIFNQKEQMTMIATAGSKKVSLPQSTRQTNKKTTQKVKVSNYTPGQSYVERYSYVNFNERKPSSTSTLNLKNCPYSTKCEKCGKIFKAITSLKRHNLLPCKENSKDKNKNSPSEEQTERPMTRAQAKRCNAFTEWKAKNNDVEAL